MKKSIAIKLLAFAMLAAAGTAEAAFLFRATLTSDQENPPISNESTSGFATFVLNDAMDALTYDLRLFGLDLRGIGTIPPTFSALAESVAMSRIFTSQGFRSHPN